MRINAAMDYRDRFKSAWDDYEDQSPCRVSLLPGKSRDTFDVVARTVEDPPLELGVLFSTWLHHLRSSLDSVIYDLAIFLTGEDPPPSPGSLQYPIAETAASFKGMQAVKALKLVAPDVVHRLKRIQPFMHEVDMRRSRLFWINELARIDRHRVMHLAVAHLDLGGIFLHGDLPFEVEHRYSPPEISSQGTPVMRIRVPKPSSSGSLRVDYKQAHILPGIPGWVGLHGGWHPTKAGFFVQDAAGLFGNMRRLEQEALVRISELTFFHAQAIHPEIEYPWKRLGSGSSFSKDLTFVNEQVARENGMNFSQRRSGTDSVVSRALWIA